MTDSLSRLAGRPRTGPSRPGITAGEPLAVAGTERSDPATPAAAVIRAAAGTPVRPALVFGIIGGCLLSVIFGIVALRQIQRTGQKGRGMAIAGLVLSGIWILLLAVGGVIAATTDDAARDSSGTITDKGRVHVNDLEVGDCINDVKDDGDVSYVDALPCAELHEGEVYASIALTGTTFPGDDAVNEKADSGCVAKLKAIAPKALQDPAVDIYWLSPSKDSWASTT